LRSPRGKKTSNLHGGSLELVGLTLARRERSTGERAACLQCPVRVRVFYWCSDEAKRPHPALGPAGSAVSCNLKGIQSMKRHLAILAFGVCVGVASQALAQVGTPLFQEDFNGLTLLPSVNIRTALNPTTEVVARADAPGTIPHQNAFTHTPPAGWVVHEDFDNFGNVDLTNLNHAPDDIVGNIGLGSKGNPDSGVDEWEGWSFADSDFWLVADFQRREEFTEGLANHSIIAVADNDEYDDFGAGDDGLYYNTGMSTGSIAVAGKSNVNLTFDSSWRDEAFDEEGHKLLGNAQVNNQAAIVYASFDGATPVQVTQWNSDPGDPNFKDDSPDETLTFPVPIPGGAQNMKLSFAYINAQNDWWWAIDNLKLQEGAATPFWSEDFESVSLGPSVNERLSDTVFVPKDTPETVPKPNSFTHTPPAGWSINNDALSTGFADDDFGLFEFEGWTFTTAAFDALASGNTQLTGFTKSTGPFALADSDAYTTGELGEGFGGPTILQTPAISLTGLAANTLKMQFDSAWRTSGDQTAEITVQYGNGPETTVLSWHSNSADPNFHATNLNETVLLSLTNPASAATAVFRFKYTGTDNWFWAIDNLKIGTEAVTATADFDSDGDVDGADFLTWQRGLGVGTTRAQGNADGDSDVDVADLAVWKSQFGQTGLSSAAAGAVPEPAGVVLSAIALAAAGLASRRHVGQAS